MIKTMLQLIKTHVQSFKAVQ